jgi:hypothetical protein
MLTGQHTSSLAARNGTRPPAPHTGPAGDGQTANPADRNACGLEPGAQAAKAIADVDRAIGDVGAEQMPPGVP